MQGWLVFILSAMLLIPSSSVAQTNHHEPSDRLSVLADAVLLTSLPLDDAVLSSSPMALELHFKEQVRLVKLVLRNNDREWVDIEFRYNPGMASHFNWPIPHLEQAAFYTAEWAILGYGDQLIKGTFSFAFGIGAELPSIQRAEIEKLNANSNNDVDRLIQTLNELSVPDVIIDSNVEPEFEPPFAPVLN